MSVIWHDLECGTYSADMQLWRDLAAEHGDPVLDVGAGTGRITLDLAQREHRVLALDQDPVLLEELRRRADGLPVEVALADAREFELAERFPLIIVPMQTIQLLGGEGGRRAFLERAQRHLDPQGGVVAIAISESLELFSIEAGTIPMPDVRELDGVVYSSQPTAVREQGDGYLLERLRETVTEAGERDVEQNVIELDRLTAAQLEREAREAGFATERRREVPPTSDHVGSVVVILGG